jgi:Rod binding domain-containing protein
MEIISSTNTQFRDFATTQQRHEAEVGRFQEMFNQALESQINPSAGATVDRAAIRQAAEAFESYFLQMMLREMRKTTLNENSFIPKSHAEKIFTDMLDERVSKDAAAAGGVGLADMIYRQMTRHLD